MPDTRFISHMAKSSILNLLTTIYLMPKSLFLALSLIIVNGALAQRSADTAAQAYRGYAQQFQKYIGQPYPSFFMHSIEGKLMSNETEKGSVMLLNFWFTTCHGCTAEIPELNELYDSVKNDRYNINFYAVAYEPRDQVIDYMHQHGVRYPVAFVKDRKESNRLNLHMGYPGTIIVDKEGKIVYITMGQISKSAGAGDRSFYHILSLLRSLAAGP